MADRLNETRHDITASMTAVLVLAGLAAAPAVIAAPERDLLCEDSAAPTLDVTDSELTATPVNNSNELLENHLLTPRAKSAVRSAFADDAEAVDAKRPELEAEDDSAVTEPGVQSAPEPAVGSFKRQMYRRDI